MTASPRFDWRETLPTACGLPRSVDLGTLAYRDHQTLTRRLVYEISGQPGSGLILGYDHPPGITIGREGSQAHVRLSAQELTARKWRVRWVARGGGCLLHLPGQLTFAPMLRLSDWNLTPASYRDFLQASVAEVLSGYGVKARLDLERPGVWIGERLVAHVGLAIRSGVTAYGATINVTPDLAPFRLVQTDGHAQPMTSLLRESTQRVDRSQLLELLSSQLTGRLLETRTKLDSRQI